MNNSFCPVFKLKILVIDDEEEFLADFKKIVNQFNHKMVGATNSKKAIELVKNSYDEMNPFDAVFIDFLMPGMDGVEVAQLLKEIDPELILIAITRDQSIKTKVRIVDSLAFRLLIPKSITPLQLERLFNVLLSTKIDQYSGDESRLARKLAYDQEKARQAKQSGSQA